MCCLFGLTDYGDALSQRQRTKIITVLSRECEGEEQMQRG